ncbi:MAG TPA: (Fe-S)-binding protein, partial [Geminicoccaceae bacterium]
MTALPPLIPDNAPFNPAQRAWLNGFFAGLLNLDQMGGATGVGPSLAEGAAALAGMAKETNGVPAAAAAGGQGEEFEAPWHDPALELPERMGLAEGKPLPQRLMAAMGQLDCGQCGYDCKAYALKLADGSEPKQNLCVPGGRATQKKVKELLNERGSADQIAAQAAVSGQPTGLAGTLAGSSGQAAPPAKPSSGISGAAVAAAVTAVAAGAVAAVAGIGRANPVTAMLKAARALNAPDSDKDTRHVVIDLEGTGITYKPGDSLGVIPENDPDLVDGIVRALGADPGAEVGDGNGHSRTLRAELITRRDLRNPTDALFTLLSGAATDRDEAATLALLADGDDPA